MFHLLGLRAEFRVNVHLVVLRTGNLVTRR